MSDAEGKPVMKPFWEITEQEADDLMQKIGITKNAVEDATVEAEVNLFDTKSAKR